MLFGRAVSTGFRFAPVSSSAVRQPAVTDSLTLVALPSRARCMENDMSLYAHCTAQSKIVYRKKMQYYHSRMSGTITAQSSA